jgi:cytochrome c-type biogenesis protein CcmF
VGFNDVYVMLTDWDDAGAVNVHIFINPLVSWIWAGGVVYLFGMFILFWPSASPARAPARAPARDGRWRRAAS